MSANHEVTPNQTVSTKKVVVGIDGSPASLDALGWAAHQAEVTSSSLEIVMTWNWPPSYGWTASFPTGYDPEEVVQKVLDEAKTAMEEKYPSMEIATRCVKGHPAPALVDASKGADLLVVGSRGHGEFLGMLIGSVSEHCATSAHCPVLVHRPVA